MKMVLGLVYLKASWVLSLLEAAQQKKALNYAYYRFREYENSPSLLQELV